MINTFLIKRRVLNIIKIIQTELDGKDINYYSKNSHKSILVECPECALNYERAIRIIYKGNHTYCSSCYYKIRGFKKVQESIGKTIKDFTCLNVYKDNTCDIRCNICNNEKTMTMTGFRKGVSHKACGKDLNMYGTQFYSIWANMRTRTNNPNYEKWHRYGGRGINSDEFEYFADFYHKLYDSYLIHVKEHGESQTTLDRIDSAGNYCSVNCRWATWDEQADNKESNLNFKVIHPNGEISSHNNLSKFCKENNLVYKEICPNFSLKDYGVPYKNRKSGLVFIKEKSND